MNGAIAWDGRDPDGGATGTPAPRVLQRICTFLRAGILACALAATSSVQAADGAPLGGIPQARDLAADGRDAGATGRVIVVLFSTAGCPWCERVREEFLKPMLANAGDRQRIIVREIEVDARTALVDFSGAATTSERFAAANRVRFVPTLAFLGPDGAPLAEPLVGFRTADYFGYYLDARIDAGLAELTRASREPPRRAARGTPP